MFQCVTGDSWASAVARPLFNVGPGEPAFDLVVVVYFLSYMLLVSMVIVNVVLAVLLDEFLRAASSEKNMQALDKISGQVLDHFQTSLDPLLESLAHTDSMPKLANNIEKLFTVMDMDGSGELDYEVRDVLFLCRLKM